MVVTVLCRSGVRSSPGATVGFGGRGWIGSWGLSSSCHSHDTTGTIVPAMYIVSYIHMTVKNGLVTGTRTVYKGIPTREGAVRRTRLEHITYKDHVYIIFRGAASTVSHNRTVKRLFFLPVIS